MTMGKLSSIKYWFIFLCVFRSGALLANDGAYLSNGSSIYPMQETKISMDKEVLSFKVVNGRCDVNVHFEFNNPENQTRKVLVGFQAPQSVGDVSEEQIQQVQIFDFIVSQGGKILPYQLKTAECEDCELLDKTTIESDQGGSYIFVYLFEVEFAPGITVIDHSYSFKAGSNVMTEEIYRYILTTGSKWSGAKIKDLTVNIDLGNDTYFYVGDVFGKQSTWAVKGIGKVTSEVYNNFETDCKMVRVVSGYLEIKTIDLNPIANIEFGVVNSHCFQLKGASERTDQMLAALKYLSSSPMMTDEKPFSKDELRIMRNTFYAQRGFVFSSKDLADYFSKFEWYIPNPNLKMTDIHFDEDVETFIQEIRGMEGK